MAKRKALTGSAVKGLSAIRTKAVVRAEAEGCQPVGHSTIFYPELTFYGTSTREQQMDFRRNLDGVPVKKTFLQRLLQMFLQISSNCPEVLSQFLVP